MPCAGWHLRFVTWETLEDVALRTVKDVDRHHTLQMAAALSYYFVLSLFPALILLSSGLAFLPTSGVMNPLLGMLSKVLPPDTISLMNQVIMSVITSNRGTLLSLGMLGTLWSASSGFAAAMEALDVAYDVEDDRPIWKTRALSILMALATGLMLLITMPVILLGPRFGEWLAARVYVSRYLVVFWPLIHWTLAAGAAILGVEMLYFLAPNVKQRFVATLPGAVLTVVCWVGLSYLLGLYFRHFASFNQTYGALGGAIALMMWLYWTSFIMLVGAEFNSELAKTTEQGKLQPKQRAA